MSGHELPMNGYADKAETGNEIMHIKGGEGRENRQLKEPKWVLEGLMPPRMKKEITMEI
jgi:hypothetical protein